MSTHIKISTITVGSGGAASIDFTSIPATYTDLKLVVSARGTSAVQILIQFNGSSANYTLIQLSGNGSAAASTNFASGYGFNMTGWMPNNASWSASAFGNWEAYIPNYAGSSFKSVSFDSVAEQNATLGYQSLLAGLWSQTAAINQLTLTPYSSNFAEFSSATLYGIKNS